MSGGDARSTPFCVLLRLKRRERAARPKTPTSISYTCYHILNNFKHKISSKFIWQKWASAVEEFLWKSSWGRFPCACLLKIITFHSAGHLREPGDHHEVCEKWRIWNLGTNNNHGFTSKFAKRNNTRPELAQLLGLVSTDFKKTQSNILRQST